MIEMAPHRADLSVKRAFNCCQVVHMMTMRFKRSRAA